MGLEPTTFCIGSRSSGAPTARTAAIRKGETINARALTEMFKTIIGLQGAAVVMRDFQQSTKAASPRCLGRA